MKSHSAEVGAGRGAGEKGASHQPLLLFSSVVRTTAWDLAAWHRQGPWGRAPALTSAEAGLALERWVNVRGCQGSG